jgi:calcineurin-like phosphoesterase family protein
MVTFAGMRQLILALLLAAAVRPIEPGRAVLPDEAASAGMTKFSFIAYGDTRGQADGSELQLEHGRIVDSIIDLASARASSSFPVRFIVQSGDAVSAGSSQDQWNVSFNPLIERMLARTGVPFFFSVGNHDVTNRSVTDPQRQPGLANASTAMANLWPPEGSARRLSGYPTYAFGYGHVFVIAIDSNIASDPRQHAWVADQLERIDRARYRHVIAVFHHPILSSGPHGGAIVENQTEALRRMYIPLFRRHHVRMTITGHDHLYEHWAERYTDDSGTHRIDHIVTGGGGAPIYTYRGEPDTSRYIAAAAPVKVALDHLVRPGWTVADNPHHYVVIQVDGDRLLLEVISTTRPEYRPYGRQVIELSDRTS